MSNVPQSAFAAAHGDHEGTNFVDRWFTVATVFARLSSYLLGQRQASSFHRAGF
jgi:hypothetical protein